MLSWLMNSCPEVACTIFGYFYLKFQGAIALGKVAMHLVSLSYTVRRAALIIAKWEDVNNEPAPLSPGIAYFLVFSAMLLEVHYIT